MSSWPPPLQPVVPPMHISQLSYSPGLDGLRALAVVAVMVYHANHDWLSGGFLGVEVFFVISGYLITLLLIGEHERLGRIDLVQFWVRRARRLLPALFVMLAALTLYMAMFNRRPLGRTRGDFIAGMLYGSNWYQIVVGQGYTDNEAFAPLRHLWSLAVEEQFYLLWPLVMVVLLRRGRERLPQVAIRLFAAALVIAIIVAIRFVPGDVQVECGPGDRNGYTSIFGRCININDTLYLSSIGRASGLLLGSAFAMVWRPAALMRGPMRRKGHLLDVIALIGLVLLGVMMVRLNLSTDGQNFGSAFDPWLFRGGFFITGIVTLLVVSAVMHRQAFLGRLLGNPVFHWIGTRSYGLYLFHWPIYQIIRRSGFGMTVAQFVLAMALTLPITELSYRFVETPIRRHGLGGWRTEARRSPAVTYRRRRRIVLALAASSSILGFAGMSLATAENRCVGAVECSFEAAGASSGSTGSLIAPSPPVTATSAAVDAGTATSASVDSASSDSGASGSGTSDVGTADTGTTNPRDLDGPGAEPSSASSPISTPGSSAPGAPGSTDAGGVPEAAAAPATTPAIESPTTSATAPTTPPTTPPTAPPPPPPPVALGDSVMLGALATLQAGGFAVDAVQNRQGTQMAELVEALRANGQIGTTVVIHIGTNGSVSQPTLDRIMAQLPADTTPNVYFLTVAAPRNWTAPNNGLIRALPAAHTNVTVLDWEVASTGVALCQDGIHLVCGTGAEQFYANVIFDGIGRPDLAR